eukprot:CAMPEP_0176474910 /NCGR_PEP_ID=MMETSP0127-20121128/43305_1 /TAXON_ID=938130 /ORGANISM="Platyophrya macrostoma, Strain WH" /LENGTH=145 /DNA_ID=CAMNT_0017870431 /DNA_START=39 /DNA_END=476 /DNA_ORIENTATION=-
MKSTGIDSFIFNFGGIKIPGKHVFLLRRNVVGIVNLKPLTDGHVNRMKLLNEAETLDLWYSAMEVQKTMEDIYKRTFTCVVQDGPEAGQTVKQVHIHVLPHVEDESIFIKASEERKPRDNDVMAEEAEKYRKLFEQNNVADVMRW